MIKNKNKFPCFYWWAVLDSNQGTQKRSDLQSDGFNHSPNYPY